MAWSSRCASVAKPWQEQTNEDAVLAEAGRIAVSDGAGGGGIYADRWSRYLLDNLPKEPITTFAELDGWVDAVWESFYDEYEQVARARGGLVLQKFYDEGSFATLAAAWATGDGRWRWMSYGDSVVFHYSRRLDRLSHSFTRLADFNKAPYLISLTYPLVEDAFRSGEFAVEDGDVVFCASDALAHYVLMEYELSRRDEYQGELAEAVSAGKRNAALVATAAERSVDFRTDVVRKLAACMGNNANFLRHAGRLLKRGFISLDDYSCSMAAAMWGRKQENK